jgi:hypothetical protein
MTRAPPSLTGLVEILMGGARLSTGNPRPNFTYQGQRVPRLEMYKPHGFAAI